MSDDAHSDIYNTYSSKNYNLFRWPLKHKRWWNSSLYTERHKKRATWLLSISSPIIDRYQQEIWANAHERRDSIGAATSRIRVQHAITTHFEWGTQICIWYRIHVADKVIWHIFYGRRCWHTTLSAYAARNKDLVGWKAMAVSWDERVGNRHTNWNLTFTKLSLVWTQNHRSKYTWMHFTLHTNYKINAMDAVK